MNETNFENNLKRIIIRYEELGNKLSSDSLNPGSHDYIQYSKEYAELTPVVAKISEFNQLKKNIAELTEIIQHSQDDDELFIMAEEELKTAKIALPKLELEVKLALLPKDKDDEKNAILEVRAGTGGEEAALFASELFHMYQRYADRRGWKFEVLSLSDTGIGGYKEAQALISGNGVFSKLKFESGVHRVQRVPATEAGGRVHTSAATVAVLPEAEEIDIKIEEKDLRIDVFRASGPGGQSVNTTDSAVRIVHIPTGIVVQQQDEKSQHKNKAKALKILRARLYEAERMAKESERAAQRKGQVGSGDRSERIRTYNFPQSRVTDHRINHTSYQMDDIINEGKIDEFVDALISADEAARLSESIE